MLLRRSPSISVITKVRKEFAASSDSARAGDLPILSVHIQFLEIMFLHSLCGRSDSGWRRETDQTVTVNEGIKRDDAADEKLVSQVWAQVQGWGRTLDGSIG
jgi:hypothetical protein